MTQQYLIGQHLRREVECCAVQMLPRLAREAISLSDLICWAAPERGDRDGFRRYAKATVALGDFTDGAGLAAD